MLRKLLGAVVAMLVCIQPAFSQTPVDEQSNEIGNSLAQCAGVYSAMSNVLSGLEKINAAQTFEDTARGAYLAAAYYSNISGIIPKWENALVWAESIHTTRTAYWLGLIELYTPTMDKAFPDDFTQALDICTKLNPVQVELVEMMRKEIYSQQ